MIKNIGPAILLCVLCTIVLFGVFSSCVVGAGVNKLSEPSSSALSARMLHVFLRPVKVSIVQPAKTAEGLHVDEAWLEQVVERYETTLLRKRVVGTRLCVRLSWIKKKDHESRGPFFEIETPGHFPPPGDDGTFFSRGAIVVAFKVDKPKDFPKMGTISLTDPGLRGKVIIEFSVPQENGSEKRETEEPEKNKDRHHNP